MSVVLKFFCVELESTHLGQLQESRRNSGWKILPLRELPVVWTFRWSAAFLSSANSAHCVLSASIDKAAGGPLDGRRTDLGRLGALAWVVTYRGKPRVRRSVLINTPERSVFIVTELTVGPRGRTVLSGEKNEKADLMCGRIARFSECKFPAVLYWATIRLQ